VVIQWYWIREGLSKECPEYCVGMTRIAREGDAPDFACGGCKNSRGDAGFVALSVGI
jgi:hypothetical protein